MTREEREPRHYLTPGDLLTPWRWTWRKWCSAVILWLLLYPVLLLVSAQLVEWSRQTTATAVQPFPAAGSTTGDDALLLNSEGIEE